MIEIKNLKKSFGKHEILKGINLTIQDKEVVVIIGPSGSGKSTILRCINYLEEPTSGEIIVDGLTLDSTKKVNEVRMEVGMVFQRCLSRYFVGRSTAACGYCQSLGHET